MRVTYDKESDAVYIYLVDLIANGEAVDTQGVWPFHVDLNDSNKVLGVEVLNASSILSQDFLDKAERIDIG